MKVATKNDLQEINESTIQPMQHGESTINESSPFSLVTSPLSPRQVILYMPLLYIPKFIIIIESMDTMGVLGISSLQMKTRF